VAGRLARMVRHLWLDEADSRRAVPPAAAQRLAEQVAASERRHTGEIGVCVEASLPLDWLWPVPDEAAVPALVRRRALSWFGQLGVWDTPDNNGVLVYVLLAERAIEIVADRALAQHVPPDAWAPVLDGLRAAWRADEPEHGLAQAVEAVGQVLETHFPARTAQERPNALPDAVWCC